MKNTKQIATITAKEFVKFATVDIQNAITKEISSIIDQFLNFKTRVWNEIDNRRICEDDMKVAELLSA